jgi:O-antigen/teichoic acid export membrane protein
MAIIGGSISDAFLQKADELAKTDPRRLRRSSIEMVIALLAVGLLPVGVLILFGPVLFSWVFGPEWQEAGTFSQVMAMYLWFQFGFTPLCPLFQVLEWVRFALVCIGTYVGAVFGSPLGAIAWFTVAMVGSYIVLGFLAFHILNEKCKSARGANLGGDSSNE